MRHVALAATLALASVAGLLLPAPAEAMYCGQRLVKNGDSRHRVRALCGEPADVIARVELRSAAAFLRGTDGTPVRVERLVEVRIDEWTYDLGPQRLLRVFVFENGRLVSMSTRGYGFE